MLIERPPSGGLFVLALTRHRKRARNHLVSQFRADERFTERKEEMPVMRPDLSFCARRHSLGHGVPEFANLLVSLRDYCIDRVAERF
jgi:hypothetical protein